MAFVVQVVEEKKTLVSKELAYSGTAVPEAVEDTSEVTQVCVAWVGTERFGPCLEVPICCCLTMECTWSAHPSKKFHLDPARIC